MILEGVTESTTLQELRERKSCPHQRYAIADQVSFICSKHNNEDCTPGEYDECRGKSAQSQSKLARSAIRSNNEIPFEEGHYPDLE